MKKLSVALFAFVPLGTAGLAYAQSTSVLYGVVDISLAKATGKPVELAGGAPLTNGSSRWGLRGTEDLGGGLKASFNLEAQLDPTTGTGSGGFIRASNLSIAGGFGALKFGRTLTPSYWGVRAWELTSAANYNVVSSQFQYAGLNARNSDEISYTSPSMGGFTVTLGHVLKGDNEGVGKMDLNLIYKNGPWSGGLSYNKLRDKGSNQVVGVSYNFGTVKLAASYHDVTDAGRGKGFTLGASVNTGPILVIVDAARDTENKDTDLLLEGRYPLSKRTFLYAAHTRNGKGKAPTDVNATMFGVRHNF
ncbi:putative porin [Hydrogenophaga palleronii]|uniref:Porin n=1 Tax=Hydrogenophaga palleronii TaxID=65655 RepID=A0ABU1WTA9_9BURK|nr:porin [Hydrogenophaga palleronii]MDR7152503.1 putative porin [Hydrogenophaga palleronii]